MADSDVRSGGVNQETVDDAKEMDRRLFQLQEQVQIELLRARVTHLLSMCGLTSTRPRSLRNARSTMQA